MVVNSAPNLEAIFRDCFGVFHSFADRLGVME